MYARGALSLEDVLPDGCRLRSGDRAEELTSGVATKREESPNRATQEEQYPKAVSKDHVDLLSKNHRRRTGLDLTPALSEHLVKDGFFLSACVSSCVI